MKNSFFVICLLLLCMVAKAEDSIPTGSLPYIVYDYDDSGNRISRLYYGEVTMPTSKSAKINKDNSDSEDEQAPEILEKVLSEELSIKLFPNPTTGVLNVECFGIEDLSNSTYMLTDINGRVLQEKTLFSHLQMIDMQNLSAGNYVLLINVDNQIYRFKIIKQ